MEVAVSKGFLIFAQNTEVDYVKQAYALALSIKSSQKEINSVSLVTNNKVPKKYQKVFEKIIPIPWFKEFDNSPLQAENRWQLYEATPYDETIVLDSDMLLLDDISYWWKYCSNFDVRFCNKIKNYKNEYILEDPIHRKTFISNQLTNPYFALHYFKKNTASYEFYKILEFVITHWEFCRGTFAPIDPQKWISMDLATAIAIHISGTESEVLDSNCPFEFVHMKTLLQKWDALTDSWQNAVHSVVTSNGELTVGNIKQSPLFHYVEKDFITDETLRRLEKVVYGS
jgi:hypothetical protein